MRVSGTVQGVGFRPFVYRLAGELGLHGSVHNDAHGVVIDAEGDAGALAALLVRLRSQAPPLARVESITVEPIAPSGVDGFAIGASARAGRPRAAVSPDTATCDDCLRELLDPGDRRYRYPFINCTNCGPRFTIVQGIPYDRARTTMAAFAMCPACRAEYENPEDRRFHAQPNACPACGPSVRADRGRSGRRRARIRSASPPAPCAPAPSSPSKASAAITSPAGPTPKRRWAGCAPASTARTSPLPSWSATSRRLRHW